MKAITNLIFFSFFLNTAYSHSPEFRKYEYLSENIWTDHVKHLAKLFKLKKCDSFLEFGVGEGTKFYLDNCAEVTSVELLAKQNKTANEVYYNLCLELFRDYSNWKPLLYKCSDAISNACEIAIQKQINPALIEPLFCLEIRTLLDNLFKEKHFDVVFVDPGIMIRGSIVNELFGRADIIVAHDVGFHPTIYGWDWIQTPNDYERIRFLEGSGTAFWIKKTQTELIKGMKEYPHQP